MKIVFVKRKLFFFGLDLFKIVSVCEMFNHENKRKSNIEIENTKDA